MTAFPRGFVPDLRRLRPWPSLRGMLWRDPGLVSLTYGALARRARATIGTRRRTVLYVGPGLGHVALELARAGHDVTGVDPDEEAVALAVRAAETDPRRSRRGALSYEVAAFPEGFEGGGPYERVLFCRVLHHIRDPAAAVERAVALLAPGGRVVCLEFAYDLLDEIGARWVARSRLWLEMSGWWPSPVGGSLEEETRTVAHSWRSDHEEEGLLTFRAMLDPLRDHLHLGPPSWHPYLFWELAAEMRAPPGREARVARQLRDREAALLRRRPGTGVLFSATGRRRRAPRDSLEG